MRAYNAGVNAPDIEIGNIDVVRQVVRLYPRFCQSLPVLEKTINDFFKGPFEVTRAQDIVQELCGTVCKYWFNALILLAANGYSGAAFSILRTMAEYTINGAYMGKHPELVEDFLDWRHVKNFRTLQDHLSLGESWASEMIEPKKRAEIEANYKRVRGRFKGRKDWCVKPIRDRACEGGLSKLYLFVYRPFVSSPHADVGSLRQTATRELYGEFGVVVDWTPSCRSVDRALRGGHLCTIAALSIFNEEMGLGRRGEVDELFDQYNRIWAEDVESGG